MSSISAPPSEAQPAGLTGTLFDGQSSRPKTVWLRVADGVLSVTEATSGAASIAPPTFSVPWTNIEILPAVGQTPATLVLPDRQEIQLDAATLAALCPPQQRGWLGWAIDRLEGKLRYAVLTLIAIIGLTVAAFVWGIPAAAKLGAMLVPESTAQGLGVEALEQLDAVILKPSKLSSSRQQQLRQTLARDCQQAGCPVYELNFRDGGPIGANAFALPGHTLIMTDDLVKAAKDDREIMAVLAHELGHVQRRHSLQGALRHLGAAGLFRYLLGNDFGVGQQLGNFLLQNSYTRDMEREADDYAFAWLKKACIPTHYFADLLLRIDKNAGHTSLLENHPGTLERIGRFQADNTVSCLRYR